jgi:hypothetical protein
LSVATPSTRPARDPRRWQLPVIVAVSTFWESLFILKGSNLLDEGWALYTGMQLGMGRRLYDEIAWVFPPGHALPAWLGHVVDPQGVIVPRLVYAAFVVLLCVALYELGRKLSPPAYAFLGALMLAVSAPRSHMMHLLYGYRYMVFAVLVLLVFARRLERGDRRYMLLAGALGGVSLFFRVTPAFAVSCGIAVALVAASRDWRSWLSDGLLYAAGLMAVMTPVLVWFAWSVGLGRVWLEVIARPMAMLQPLPVPDLVFPAAFDRDALTEAWRPLQLRVFGVLYAGYAIGLAVSWWRAFRAGRPFEHVLLVAVVVWGSVFFLRSFGRADEAHMDTTLPPICLLIAHAVGLGVERWRARGGGTDRGETSRVGAPVIACTLVFATWVLLTGSDRYPLPHRFQRVGLPYKVTSSVEVIERHTPPGATILDLSAAPMFHALTGRPGPGRADVIMEGTFIDAGEELAFIDLLERDPPVAVLWPVRHFDEMPSRAISVVAPRLATWVALRYVPVERSAKFVLGLPRGRAAAGLPGSARPGAPRDATRP